MLPPFNTRMSSLVLLLEFIESQEGIMTAAGSILVPLGLNLSQELFFGLGNLGLAFGMGEPLGTKSLLLDILCGFSLSFRVLTDGCMGSLIHIFDLKKKGFESLIITMI